MDRIGRYQIIGELGRGAMGLVYHATDPAIGRSVAIKIIRIRDAGDTRQSDKLRERLFREARSAGVLSHPNIVTIYDMDEVDGMAYIAMAYVNGPTLYKILASGDPLSGARMLRVLRQTASALDYAHSRGIVHRDVKPANIMTDEDGAVKITDFGIAKITSGANITDTRTVVGTPNYMSPEQVQGLEIDGRSDQFSLAVIAYEILTGERPFQGEHLSTIVYRIVQEEPEEAQRINGTLTPQIDAVLRRALAKKPEGRYPNCSSFVGALEMACAESRGWKTLAAGSAAAMPTLAVDPVPVVVTAAPPVSRSRVHPPVASAPVISVPIAPPPVVPPPAAKLVLPPPRAVAPQRRRSAALPLFFGIIVLLGVAGVIAWQAGGIPGVVSFGQPPEVPAAATETQLPPAQAAPEPVPAPPAVDSDKVDSDKVDSGKPEVAKEEAPQQTKPVAPDETGHQETAPPATGRRSPFQTARADAPAAVSGTAPRGRLQDVWVNTNPAGAKVVLDGNLDQSCLTPCMQHSPPGVHHLTISQAGYLNEYREIHVGDEAQDLPPITLRQPGGTLMITSEPSGASIRINGQLVTEKTPAALTLKPGSYSLTVEKDGATHTQQISVPDGTMYVRIPLGQ